MNKITQSFWISIAAAGLTATAAPAANIPVQFTMGTEVSYFKYEEPDVMDETGVLVGIVGDYTLRTPENDRVSSWRDFLNSYANNYMFGVDGRFAFGRLDYDSSSTGSIDNIDEYLFEIRGVAGYDFSVGEDTVLTPYFGIGYRLLDDNTGGKTSTTGHAGYDRESHYVYMPLGIRTSTPINADWTWGVTFEYDIFLYGKQKSHLEDVSAALSTLENDQEDGFGIRGSLLFARKTDRLDLLAEPFVRYWDINESSTSVITCGGTPCASGYEPKNRSIEYGFKLGARF